jgi:ring-1,2-phenylacetyl-CoA epoxidase subunit PaaE
MENQEPSSKTRFHALRVAAVLPEAKASVAITLGVPEALRAAFHFEPGQFVTLRVLIAGQEERRSYSICSTPDRLLGRGEIEIGVRPVAGGLVSNWLALELRAGMVLEVMPPDGRFVSRRPRALHRVGFAAGSGITPILSIMCHSLETQPQTKFTLVYGNHNMGSVMFNERLQDLKDRWPERLTLIHVLSRQAQEVDLLQGRVDGPKVHAIVRALLPAASMDEAFVCGPEGMIEATQAALVEAGVPQQHIRTERFSSPRLEAVAPKDRRDAASVASPEQLAGGSVALHLTLDGKLHELRMQPHERVLDVALAAGLDLPFSCKAGVCCTCRAKVTAGAVRMQRNFTLEPWEEEQGFALTCQACPTTPEVSVNFDHR